MIYSPHLCAIVVLIGPSCLELRASPSFRKSCVWYSTKLSYAVLVFESVQITKTRDMGITYAQGFLERHCDGAAKGAIESQVRTTSLLSSESDLYSYQTMVATHQTLLIRCLNACLKIGLRSRLLADATSTTEAPCTA